MNCPHCQSENRDEARFCDNCGMPLQMICPVCRTVNRLTAKFCDNCGTDLRQIARGSAPPAPPPPPSPDPKPQASAADALARYLPPELRVKLEAARANGRMAGERRVVTALFCDVKGSTAAAEHLDPEDWSEIINGAFEAMIRPVYAYEGTVARLMGDGLLAFFGAPMAHEDDPQRAVMAGLEIVDGVRSYGERARLRWGIDVAVRVGINTGLVVVGEVGSDLRVEYSALGDAVNLAARMEQTAVAGTVQVADQTYRLVAPYFDFESLGPLQVKGKEEPVNVYRALRLRPEHSRLHGAEPLAAPFVGREQEMAALRRNLDALRAGVGQIVFVIGEAGLGKSRLVEEARRSWLSGAVEAGPTGSIARWIESYSASYEADKPYSQFRRMIRQFADIGHDDGAVESRAKVAAFLAGFSTPPIHEAEEVLAVLLGLAPEPETAAAAQAWKRDLFGIIRDLVERWSAAGSGVIIFDDLQWIDPASAELLISLLSLTDGSPILILCCMRPDRQAISWTVKAAAERDYAYRTTEINLGPLPEGESRKLVEYLLSASPAAIGLAGQVVDRAEGNPLFLEEVVRGLLDQGMKGADRIPESLQALLTARIDRLDDKARRTLQMASVIGRRFLHRVLLQICDPSIDLDAELTVLQRADLVREAARFPELEFLFRHALIQEAAYRTILRRQRRDFHRQVGEGIERVFAHRLDEFATQLAHHFDEAEDPRAVKYYELAGNTARRLYANTEAAMLYGRALELALANSASIPTDLNNLYRRKGRALEMEGRYAEALATYEDMEATGERRQDGHLLLSALVEQTQVRSTPNSMFDGPKAEALAQRALAIARELGDEPAEARILWATMNLGRFSEGRLAQSRADGERALEIARRLNLREDVAFITNDMLDLAGLHGDIERARELGVEAVALWREIGNLPMLADSLSGSSAYDIFAGDYDAALQKTAEAYQISRSIANVWGQSYSQSMVGLIYCDRGEIERAIAVSEEAVRLAEMAGFVPAQIFTRNILVICFQDLGQYARAREVAERAVEVGEQNMQFFRFSAISALMSTYLDEGRIDEAEALYAQNVHAASTANPFIMFEQNAEPMIALARRRYDIALAFAARELAAARASGLRRREPDLFYVRGLALRGQGRSEEAIAAFQEALGRYDALQARRLLWPVLVLLAELEQERGRSDVARAYLAAAREAVAYTANKISNPAWRASYLARPEVMKVLAGD